MDNITVMDFLTKEDHTNKLVRERLLAPIVYLIIVLIIGIPGNTFVLIIYRNYNNNVYRKIIWTVGALDLVFCMIGTPFNLGRMFNYYNFKSLRACQVIAGMLDAGIITTAHLLMLLSVHRFRQVCLPLGRQLTLTTVSYFIAGCFAIGVILGIPQVAVLQPLATTDLGNNVTGYSCSVGWKDSPQSWKNYNTFLTSIFLLYAFILLVLYILIGRTIQIQNKKRKKGLHGKQLQSAKSTNDSHKMTKIAFTVSTVFAFSYLPLFVNEWATKGLNEKNMDLFTFSLLKIVQRAYLINHVVNPFIYATFDRRFRHQVKDLIICRIMNNEKVSDTDSSATKPSTSATSV